jgi:hypothetical protein
MKWLLQTWWGRLFILVQGACLASSIYLAVTFVTNSHKEEEGEIAATLNAEDTSKFFGEKVPPAGEQNRFDTEIERVKNEHSQKRQTIPIYYLLSNLVVPAIWCIGLFICNGFPTKSRTEPPS